MLADQPLTDQWAPGGATVVSIGGQTARSIDDVGAVTGSGGQLLIQAKSRLELGTTETSPLAKALRQVVAQYVAGIPTNLENGTVARPIDPDRDRLIIVTDLEAPLTVRKGLIPAADAMSELEDSLPFEDVRGNQEIVEGRTVLIAHLRREWANVRGAQPEGADLRGILEVLRIIAVDLNDDGEQYGRALLLIRPLCAHPQTASAAWRVLFARCHELAERSQWATKSRLRQKLASDGIVLGNEARFQHDISRLIRITEANVRTLASALTIAAPEGAVALARTLEPQLLTDTENLAVTGAPGVGKSVLLHALATASTGSHDVVLLRSDDLKSSRGATQAELGIQHHLGELLEEWTGPLPGLLLIDGLDQNTGEHTPAWLPDLAERLRSTRWRIVASIRTYDLTHSRKWRSMFAGAPPVAQAADPSLTGVRHMLVADLTAEELAPLRVSSPRLAGMLDRADARLRELLVNPFNLDMAARLLADGNEGLTSVRSQVELLRRYWTRRMAPDGAGRAARARALEVLVREMLASGRQAINPIDLPDTREHVDDLRRAGVLRDVAGRDDLAPPVQFSHRVLFDYVAAQLVLGDRTRPESLAEILDRDPNLALLVRPSIEYRLADIWEADSSRRSFWRLALRLASTDHGHILAALAAARVGARYMGATSDVAFLHDACAGVTLDPAGQWGIEQAHQLAFLLAACTARRPRSKTGQQVLADLAAALTADARQIDDPALASLAAQMLLRAFPDPAEDPGLTLAARTTAAINCVYLAVAGIGEPSHSQLGGFAARLLGCVVGWDPSGVTAAVNAIIEPSVLAAWGESAIWPLIEQVPQIARSNPKLAVDIAAASWEYEQPLKGVNEPPGTVDDLLGGARYAVGARFPALMTEDPFAATRLLLRLVGLPRLSPPPQPADDGNRPLLRVAEPLELAGGHEALVEIAHHFVNALGNLADRAATSNDAAQTVSQITTRLVMELHHDQVWRLLLTSAATTAPIPLGHALLPAITARAPYAFPTTWAAAAHLAARLSPTLTSREHESLEAVLCTMAEPDPPLPGSQFPERLKQRARSVLNALDASRLGPVAARLLSADDDPPRPLPNLTDDNDHGIRVWSESPEPGSLGELAATVQAAAQSLNEPSARAHGFQRLAELWSDLPPATPPTAEQHQYVRLDLAKLLANSPSVTPGSTLGRQIYRALQEAKPGPGELHVSASWSASSAGFEVTPRTNAVEGLVNLRLRPDWAPKHDPITRTLNALLNSPSPIERYLASRALPALHPSDIDLIAALEDRLRREDDPTVATRLMVQLAAKRHDEPQLVDQALQRLSQTPLWAALAAEPEGDQTLDPDDRAGIGIDILATLACLHPATHASVVVAHWLAEPVTHPHRCARVLWTFRDVYNPPEPKLRLAQQRVFELLQPGLAKLPSAYNAAAELTAPEPVARDAALNATKVAETLARQLFTASGAFDYANNTPPARGDVARFTALALPALDTLANIHSARVTRHVVATAAHLAAEEPKQTLLIAARAVKGDQGYWRDPGGLDTVLKLVRNYVTNHRSTVFDGAECTTALRHMLESFTRLGWEQAVDMLDELDELHH